MGFWIFMLIMDLLLPAVMVFFGKRFMKKSPEEINPLFGYRSSMSMKNRDTWVFAHTYCGKLWFYSGLILLPLSVIPLLFVIDQSKDLVGTVGSIVCFFQMAVLFVTIPLVERALRNTFDKDGNRKQP